MNNNKLCLIEEWIVRQTLVTLSEDFGFSYLDENDTDELLRIMKRKIDKLRGKK